VQGVDAQRAALDHGPREVEARVLVPAAPLVEVGARERDRGEQECDKAPAHRAHGRPILPPMTVRARGLFFAGLALLTAVAAWMRLETLGRRPLWFDERFTFFMCAHAKSLRGIWTIATKDAWSTLPSTTR
jgi:hypothetical protein